MNKRNIEHTHTHERLHTTTIKERKNNRKVSADVVGESNRTKRRRKTGNGIVILQVKMLMRRRATDCVDAALKTEKATTKSFLRTDLRWAKNIWLFMLCLHSDSSSQRYTNICKEFYTHFTDKKPSDLRSSCVSVYFLSQSIGIDNRDDFYGDNMIFSITINTHRVQFMHVCAEKYSSLHHTTLKLFERLLWNTLYNSLWQLTQRQNITKEMNGLWTSLWRRHCCCCRHRSRRCRCRRTTRIHWSMKTRAIQ